MVFAILHGIAGEAGKYWQQWLSDTLKSEGHEVIMPTLPTSDRPVRTEWNGIIGDLLRTKDHDKLILIGHSLGVPAALDYVDINNQEIKGLVSIAGFYQDYGLELNSYYMAERDIDIKKVSSLIKHKFVIFGNDDPYVPQETLKALADGLEVKPYLIPKGGHFNGDTIYGKRMWMLMDLIDSIA